MATWTIVTTKETAAKIPNNYFFFPVPFHYLTRTTFQYWNLSKFPYFHENLQEMHAIKRSWLRRRTYSAVYTCSRSIKMVWIWKEFICLYKYYNFGNSIQSLTFLTKYLSATPVTEGKGRHRIRGNNSNRPNLRDRGQPIVLWLKLTSKVEYA